MVCGDLNIYLLKPSDHPKTTEFVNTMLSLSFYPLIIKPSRITKDSATLIDNIFINLIEGNAISGLLVADISDHFPVFTVFEMSKKVKSTANRDINKLVRIKSPEAIKALKAELLNHDWPSFFMRATSTSCSS